MRKLFIFTYFLIFSFNLYTESIKVSAPNGLPALVLAKMITQDKVLKNKKIEYTIEKTSDSLVTSMLKRNPDIAIVPTNFAAQLYNKNLNYQIVGTVIWGSLYIVSREKLDTLSDLVGKNIYSFGKGLTPDIIFTLLLNKEGVDFTKLKLNYLATPNEVALSFFSKKADTILIPEPILTNILIKDKNAVISFKLNEMWKKKFKNKLGFPQATLVVKTELIEKNPIFVDEFLLKIEESTKFINQNPEGLEDYLENIPLKINHNSIQEVIERGNILFVPIQLSKEDYLNYFKEIFSINPKIIGGKLPNEKIFKK